jgi:tetratricopeptide (TPR) repeat protein
LLQVGDRDLLPHLLAGAAEAALNRSEHALALKRVSLALEACEASSDPLGEVAARRVAGRIAAAAGQALEARAYFDRALEVAESLDSATDTSRVAFDYAQVLERLGDSPQAFLRYRQAYRAKEAGSRG